MMILTIHHTSSGFHGNIVEDEDVDVDVDRENGYDGTCDGY